LKQAPVIAMPEKLIDYFTKAHALNPHETNLAIKQCTERLGRLIGRQEALDGEAWEDYRLRPARGPALNFTGRVLYDYEAAAHRSARQQAFIIYETGAGTLVVELHLVGQHDGEYMIAEAFPLQDGDIQAQRESVMQFLAWSNEAKAMARKLGWVMERTIP
jgi:hypothetical protein